MSKTRKIFNTFITIRVPDWIIYALDEEARKKNMSRSQLVREIIEKHIRSSTTISAF